MPPVMSTKKNFFALVEFGKSTKIPPVNPPSEISDENVPTKLSLADVIIAAAAAKTVKLKSKGRAGL